MTELLPEQFIELFVMVLLAGFSTGILLELFFALFHKK